MVTIKSIEELFGTLQQSVVAEWRKHLKADNHDVHVILDEFYKEMPEKVDKLIEDFMGHNKQKVGDYKNVLDADEYDALEYLEELHSVCDAGRKLLNEVPELESDLDDVVGLIDSCMYKLRELTKVKESFRMKSLTEFLYESLEKTPDERLDLDSLSDTELESLVEDILKHNKDFDKKYVDKAVHALLGNGYKVTAANFISKTCKASGDDEVHFIYSNDNNQWWDPEKGVWTAF